MRPPIRTVVAPDRRGSFVMRSPSNHESPLKTVDEIEAPITKENWQQDAYSFVEAIGEVGYALNLKANMIGRCVIRPEVRVPNTDEWVETDDPRVLRVLAAFKPPEGGQGELLRQAALNYEIAGECYLFGQPIVDERKRSAGLLWEFLSTLELKVEKGGKVTRNAWGGSQGKQDVDVDAYVARLHHRDPRYSARADCPMRRVLPICRELVLLTQVIDAIAKSRLAAGLFYVPWEVSFGPSDEFENPGDPATGGDEFEEELARHINSPIEDRTSASSLVPLLMRGPAFIKDHPAKDLMGRIDLTRDLDGLYKDLRQEALERLAAGLDINPEVMTGKANLNHWTGYNVDADFIAKHVIPLGDVIVGFISSAYLRPMLTIFEALEPEETEWFRLALDVTPITAETDLSDNATTGFGLEIVSEDAWVRLNGLDEADMPSTEERERRTLERLLYAQPTLGPAILPLLYPDDKDLPAALEKWQTGQSAPGGAQDPPGAIGPPQSGGAEPPNVPRLANVSPTVLGVLLAAADRELDRGLERAANRLISRFNGIDREEADRLRGSKRSEVLTVAGSELAIRAGLGREELFSGCWNDLQIRVADWLRVALVDQGADPYLAQQSAEVAAAELAEQLSMYAVTALDRRLSVGANGFKIPTELVVSALVAGDLIRS